MLNRLFRKAFGIRTHEGANAIRFARLATLWAFGSSCLDTLSDGLFLENIGADSLPVIYLSIALCMIGISSLVLYSLQLTSPYRILTIAMCLGITLCLGAAWGLSQGLNGPFFYVIKILSKMFFAVMVAITWTFTDQYHDLQDAKRVYSIYNAAYFFGTILAGSAIYFFLDQVGPSGLLTLAACSISLGLIQARGIAKNVQAVHDDSIEGVFERSKDSLSFVVRLISRSPFTIILLLLSLFMQLLLTVTEFNYMDSMTHAFNQAQLGDSSIAGFLGKCRACISTGNIVIGFFLYSRFLRRTGLANVILITPLFFLGVYCGWAFFDGLGIAIFGLIACDGILFTVEDNCFNLFSNAVPSKLKSKVRIINDSFFEPIGMLLSASLLFGFQQGSYWLGFSLSLITLTLSWALRSIYSKAIFINLKDNALHFERKLKDWFSLWTKRETKEAHKAILSSLRSCDTEMQLLAIDALLEMKESGALFEVLHIARQMRPPFQVRLLRYFENSFFHSHPSVIALVEEWAEEGSPPQLMKWANCYLAKRGLYNPKQAEEELDHEDPFIRASAILTFKHSLEDHLSDYAALNRTIANKQLTLMLKSDRIEELSIALDILGEDSSARSAEKALPFLSHESVLVKRAASRSIAKLSNKALSRLSPRIIEEMEVIKDSVSRLYLLESLGKMADSTTVKEILLASIHFRATERRKAEEIIVLMGLKIVPLLLSLTKDLSLPERARLLAGKILGRLALPQLQANLMDILDIEIDRAYFYFYFAHTIQTHHPLYDLQMLESALMTGYQSVIDFIIHLLGAAGSLEDPDLLVRALQSPNAKIQSHAVESLEKTCNTRIFRMIAPLVDDLPLEEKMHACLSWHGDFPKLTLSELLSKLEASPSLFDKIVAVRLKANLQMPHWRQELRFQMKSADETFHQYAYELLEL